MYSMEKRIRELLAAIVHPETERDLVASGFVEHVAAAADKATVVLRFAKGRDPFAVKIKKAVEEALRREFPAAEVLVVVKEGGAAPRPEPKTTSSAGDIARVIAIASGKGGVGKSTVAANPRCSVSKDTSPTPCGRRASTASSRPTRRASS